MATPNNTDDFDQNANALADARLSFIGAGVMAEAMIAGLLKQRLVPPAQIIGSHPRPARREELATKYGISVLEDNRAAAAESSIIVLAVKPQKLHGVLRELNETLRPEQLVVSIIAGARLETIAGELLHPAIVRAMPNTPAQIGEGMTVWTATAHVSDAQAEQVRAMLGALGREMRVAEERQVDMATALSATGPTYIFLVMEALVDAGVHMGFSREVARELVVQTMLGATLFAQESHKHPAELRNMVTSPGGTSAEAIYQMEKGSLRTVLSKAVYAAYQRAVALGKK
ncbi:MAG: pyrroline-5-carboxylate reductase [Acidobacteria bacterium]|nr:MAG: pyrroline-5-carboxylate reductase [Acidobacteriota bacterium]